MKVYLVAAPCGEFVGFLDKKDAFYASTGIRSRSSFGTSSLAENFRECYAEDGWDNDDDEEEMDESLPMITVELTPEQVAACKFDIK
jgi:hypothetical protein